MLIKDFEGQKYPDEYIVRMFFKEKLFSLKSHVLELGCGNGSNLTLFYQYGWDVTGADVNERMIDIGKKNFHNLSKEPELKNKYEFFVEDMVTFVKSTRTSCDVILFPGTIYYLEPLKIIELFSLIKANNLLHSGSFLYFRIRLLNDFRYGKGTEIATNCFRLTDNVTNEENCIMTFFSEEGFIKLLSEYFVFSNLKVMHNLFDSYDYTNEILIPDNSDLIVLGKIK